MGKWEWWTTSAMGYASQFTFYLALLFSYVFEIAIDYNFGYPWRALGLIMFTGLAGGSHLHQPF